MRIDCVSIRSCRARDKWVLGNVDDSRKFAENIYIVDKISPFEQRYFIQDKWCQSSVDSGRNL